MEYAYKIRAIPLLNWDLIEYPKDMNAKKVISLSKDQELAPVSYTHLNSMRLKHLIEDLFEVSKANSGDLKLNVVDVDLVSLISQTLFELAPAIEKAGLTIKTCLLYTSRCV